jgi:hypothetical protein
MVRAGLNLPGPPLDIPPASFPHGHLVTVVGLQLHGVDHPEATSRLHREGDDGVARLRHVTHEGTGASAVVPDVGCVAMCQL